MAIKYSWSFPSFECAPSLDGLTDVVKTIHWRYSGVDGVYQNDLYGSVGLDEPQANNFTPFEELSQNTVVSWVLEKAQYSLTEMKSIISTNINNQKNPPIVTKTAPWA